MRSKNNNPPESKDIQQLPNLMAEEAIQDRFSIRYSGSSLVDGRMEAVLLADGLKGTARLVNRVAEMYFGSKNGIHLEVEGEPQRGSIEVFIHFAQPAVSAIEAIGTSKFLTGLAVIATLSGFTAKDLGKSLWALFKTLHGLRITDDTNLSILPSNSDIELPELVRIYNDQEVQASMRAAVRPLRSEGIELYETRRNGETVEAFTRAEVESADAAELAALVANEEKVLAVEKASFVPHLAWHFSDEGRPFDAKIEAPAFWQEVASGNRFGYGDRLHVTLHTEGERDYKGRLRLTRTVTRVHRIERLSGEQISLKFE